MRKLFILLMVLTTVSLCLFSCFSGKSDYASSVIRLDSFFLSNVVPGIKGIKLQAAKANDRTLNNVIELYAIDTVIHWHPQNPTDAIPEKLNKKISSFEKTDQQKLKLHAMVLLSMYYWIRTQNHTEALELALKAYNEYHDFTPEEFPLKNRFLFELGGMFYYYQDFVNAKKYLLEAAEIPAFGQPSKYTILNSLALSYRNLAQYDSADYYLKKAIPYVTNTDIVWNGILQGNIGINYYLQKKYDAAIPLLWKDIKLSLDHNAAVDNGANSEAILGDIYFQRNNTDSALFYLNQACFFIKRDSLWDRYELLVHAFTPLAGIYKRSNNNEKAYYYLNAAMKAKDTLIAKRNALIATGINNKVEAERHNTQLYALDQQRKLQGYLRNGLLAGIILLTSIGLLFISRQKFYYKYKQEQLALKKLAAEDELREAGKLLEVFTKTIQEKNKLIEQFTLEINSGSSGIAEDPDNEILSRLKEFTILTEDQWADFRNLFEKVHPGFFNRLKNKFPDVSPADIRFIALAKLNLSNKEIAAALGVGAGAIRVTRSRLRKKLPFDSDEALIDILHTI